MYIRYDTMLPEEREYFNAHPYEFGFDPFKVCGNLYFIGNKEVAAYMIDTGEGLVLIDSSFPNMSNMLIDSIYQLGYNPREVKWIFHSHAHADHYGSSVYLKQLTGCKLTLSRRDYEDYFLNAPQGDPFMNMKYLHFVPDVFPEDGEVFEIGNTSIRVVNTPGHTKGCQSFFIDVTDDDGTHYVAAMHGGVGINTMHEAVMKRMDFPDCREVFRTNTEELLKQHVDIYLGSHTFQSFMVEKREKQLADPDCPNPFIDPDEWHRILQGALDALDELIEAENNGYYGTVPQ